MDDKLIRSWLDIVAQYLTFLLRFPRDAGRALEKYAGTGVVHPELVSFALAGIGLSYVFVLLIAVPELAADRGSVVSWFRGTDIRIIPGAILMAVLAASIVFHVAAQAHMKLAGRGVARARSRGRRQAYLGGTVEDSVNAALAFAAFAVPALVLATLLGLSWAASHPGHEAVVGIALAIISLLMLGLLFPSALAGLHPGTGTVEAFLAIVEAMGLIVVLVALWALRW
jgi:hypothetical protein